MISAEQIYESNPELVLKAKTDLLLKKEKKGLFSGVVGLMKSAFGHSKTEKSKSESELHTFKGDLAPKETVVSAKAEALPKVITETPDQDTSDAVVLFKQADCYFDGWICGECDTENKAGRQYCVVCGSNQEKRG